MRRASTFNTRRIDHLYIDSHESDASFFLHYADLSGSEQLARIFEDIKPDEVYNLAAQSHVRVSFDLPEYTAGVTGLGTTRVLEAMRHSSPSARLYQASSSEMFGSAPPPQSEDTPFMPRSPYAAAKVYAYWMTVNYRQGYDLHCVNGILFNHESPRRGETFVTRKITRAVARILADKQDRLFLGNLDSKRDWGYAPEYVEAMWASLQREEPTDYVIGTGESHTVQEFIETAFDYVGLDWRTYVSTDPRYLRPTEVDHLRADTTKAKMELDWSPKVSFDELVWIMVDADMEEADLKPPGKGRKTLASKFGDWHSWPYTPSTGRVHE